MKPAYNEKNFGPLRFRYGKVSIHKLPWLCRVKKGRLCKPNAIIIINNNTTTTTTTSNKNNHNNLKDNLRFDNASEFAKQIREEKNPSSIFQEMVGIALLNNLWTNLL